MRLEGKWVGQYTYGEDYPESYKGRSVLFEFNLIANGIEFSGNFSDDETRSVFHDEGIVAGYIEGDYVCFDKQYPKKWHTVPNGTIEVIEDSIPPIIKYEGSRVGDQFEGVWEIHQYHKEENDDDEMYSLIMGQGTWSMKKES